MTLHPLVLTALPQDAVFAVFRQLPYATLQTCKYVCRLFEKLIREKAFMLPYIPPKVGESFFDHLCQNCPGFEDKMVRIVIKFAHNAPDKEHSALLVKLANASDHFRLIIDCWQGGEEISLKPKLCIFTQIQPPPHDSSQKPFSSSLVSSKGRIRLTAANRAVILRAIIDIGREKFYGFGIAVNCYNSEEGKKFHQLLEVPLKEWLFYVPYREFCVMFVVLAVLDTLHNRFHTD